MIITVQKRHPGVSQIILRRGVLYFLYFSFHLREGIALHEDLQAELGPGLDRGH